MHTSRSVDLECIILTEYLMIQRFNVVQKWFMVTTQYQFLRHDLPKGKYTFN